MATNRRANSAGREKYYDLQRHWTRKIVPHLKDKALNGILVRDFNKFTMGRWNRPFVQGNWPEEFDATDWRGGRRDPRPRYFRYANYLCSHWLVNFQLRLAELAEPNKGWRIVTSEMWSTVWNGQETLFEFTLQATGESADWARKMATDAGGSRVLPIGQQLELRSARHYSISDKV